MKMKRGILIICIVLSFLFVGCVPTEGNTEVEETQVDPSNNDKGAI